MKKIILLPAFCILSFFAKSQEIKKEGFKIGLGGSLAIPASNLQYSSVGGGLDVLALYGISNKILLSADAGFTTLSGKSFFPSTAIIPIRLGVRYLPIDKLYLTAKAGLGIYTIIKKSSNYFAYSLGAGYLLSPKFDLGASFDGYSKQSSPFGYVAIRLGYTFGK